MPVITPTKAQAQLIVLQNIATAAAAAGKVSSAVVDVRTKYAATIGIHIGRTVVTAFAASSGVLVLLEGAMGTPNGVAPTDNTEWFPLATRDTGPLVACNTNTLSAGDTTGQGDTGVGVSGISMTAVAALDYSLAKDLLYFSQGGTAVSNGEFHHCRYATTGTSVMYLEDNMTRNQASAVMFNGNMEWVVPLDLSSVDYLRVTVINNTGQSIAVEAFIVSLDSVLVS